MFDGKKYITNGIENTLPPGMDRLLWLLIETTEKNAGLITYLKERRLYINDPIEVCEKEQ